MIAVFIFKTSSETGTFQPDSNIIVSVYVEIGATAQEDAYHTGQQQQSWCEKDVSSHFRLSYIHNVRCSLWSQEFRNIVGTVNEHGPMKSLEEGQTTLSAAPVFSALRSSCSRRSGSKTYPPLHSSTAIGDPGNGSGDKWREGDRGTKEQVDDNKQHTHGGVSSPRCVVVMHQLLCTRFISRRASTLSEHINGEPSSHEVHGYCTLHPHTDLSSVCLNFVLSLRVSQL